MTDDQTVDSMRFMPHVEAEDRGSRARRFAQSFVNYSLCCPSRSTFLTGQYAHNHGVMGNSRPIGGFDSQLDIDQHPRRSGCSGPATTPA